MDNLVTGLIGMVMLACFLGGLAISIGSVPFGIIVVAVLAMALVDFFQNVRDSWKQ